MIGISGCLSRWISSFLLDRTQQILVDNHLSQPYSIHTGVPQGTCLAPILFCIYINDIVDCLPNGVDCTLYADDLKLSTYNDIILMQEAIDCVDKWSNTWGLTISTTKTATMHLGTNHPSCSFTLNTKTLPIVHEFTDLGITYNECLSYKPHLHNVIIKAKQRSHFILRSFKSKNPLFLYKLFATYVRPILEYCSPLWSPYTQADILNIEKIQDSFLHRAFLRRGVHEEREERRRKVGTNTLEERRQIADMKLFKSILTNENSTLSSMVLVNTHTYNTRYNSDNNRVFIPRLIKMQHFHSFYPRAARHFNCN